MHSVTLVTDVHLSKLEAFSLLIGALDAEVDSTKPGEPVLVLAHGAEISIEVPKFGEDLPLTLDVRGPDQVDVASASVTVMAQLTQALNWSVSRVGGTQ